MIENGSLSFGLLYRGDNSEIWYFNYTWIISFCYMSPYTFSQTTKVITGSDVNRRDDFLQVMGNTRKYKDSVS